MELNNNMKTMYVTGTESNNLLGYFRNHNIDESKIINESDWHHSAVE